MRKLDCYLHTHRRQWGFTQQEVAFLLGLKDRSSVAWLELGRRDPNIKSALGCEVLFGAAPRDLFPKTYGKIQDALLRRAYVLDQRLKREASPQAEAKRKLLADVLSRAVEFSSEQEV
jgi:transcriptional regulator with XRE-family HTH domain